MPTSRNQDLDGVTQTRITAAFQVGDSVFLTLHSSEIRTRGCLTLRNQETLYLPSPGVLEGPNFPAVCTAQGYHERGITHAMRKRLTCGKACSSRPLIQTHVAGFLWAGLCCALRNHKAHVCARGAAARDPGGVLRAGNADDAERDGSTFGGTENDEEKQDRVRQVAVSR